MLRSIVRWLVVALILAGTAPALAGTVGKILRGLSAAQAGRIERGLDRLAVLGFVAGVPPAGMPPLSMSDATQSIASPIAVAASWDAATARAYGAGLAAVARAGGADVLAVPLGPLGDDPVLTSRTIAPLVRGVQEEHVIAAPFGRTGGSDDARTLHERDWPALEAAIVEGKAGAVTCAMRDGRTSSLCGDHRAFATMLSRDVRFDGFAIDAKSRQLGSVDRVIGTMARVGVLAHPPHVSGAADVDAELSRRVVQNGAVLLKNDAEVLPLDPSTLRSLALIGADAATQTGLTAALGRTLVTNVAAGDPAAAAGAARKAEAAVIVLPAAPSSDESATVAAVTAANPRTIVVLERDIVEEPAWAVEAPAILIAWAPAPGTPAAIVNLLTGAAGPAGHLPLAIPGFGFGTGLAYTTFAYSDLRVAYGRTAASAPVTISFEIRNTGRRSGTAVPQLYLRFPATSGKGSPVLASFARITLGAGASRRVTLPLKARSFAYWSSGYKAWFVAPGTYRATLGSSAADASLAGDVRIVAR